MANVWRDATRRDAARRRGSAASVHRAASVHGAISVHRAGSVHGAMRGCRCAVVSDTRGQTFGRECHWWARRLCSARKGNLSAATVPASANAQHQGGSARLPVSPAASCSPAWLTNSRIGADLWTRREGDGGTGNGTGTGTGTEQQRNPATNRVSSPVRCRCCA